MGKCIGYKMSRNRAILWMCQDQRNFLMIEKFKTSMRSKHQAFIHSIVKPGWHYLFLKNLDAGTKNLEQKILLLVDNYPAHPYVDQLSKILMPVNTIWMVNGVICSHTRYKIYNRRVVTFHIIQSRGIRDKSKMLYVLLSRHWRVCQFSQY